MTDKYLPAADDVTGEFTCLSCVHSTAKLADDYSTLDLMCCKTGDLCGDPCGDFEYEPGTDEAEHAGK